MPAVDDAMQALILEVEDYLLALVVVRQIVRDESDALVTLVEASGFLTERLSDGLVDRTPTIDFTRIDVAPAPQVTRYSGGGGKERCRALSCRSARAENGTVSWGTETST